MLQLPGDAAAKALCAQNLSTKLIRLVSLRTHRPETNPSVSEDGRAADLVSINIELMKYAEAQRRLDQLYLAKLRNCLICTSPSGNTALIWRLPPMASMYRRSVLMYISVRRSSLEIDP